MRIGTVDHAWIREHLGWSPAEGSVLTSQSLSRSSDMMGSVHRVACGGRSFVIKGPPGDLSPWGNLLSDMGMREVQTYRLLESRGPVAPKVSPTCYWSAAHDDGSGALALEDLGPGPELSHTMAEGLSTGQVVAAVRCLALAHASFATDRTGAHTSPYPWLYTPASAGLIDAIAMGLDDLPGMVARYWPGHFSPDALRAIKTINVAELLDRSHTGTRFVSLCHGDAWPGNLLFTPGHDPAAYLIDWQFAMWGNPLSDVAFLLYSSLHPPERAAREAGLVDIYHATLVAHADIGVTRADCREAFQRSRAGAALVALATLDGFTAGLNTAQLSRLAPRVAAAMDVVTGT